MALIYKYNGGAITHKVAPSGISLTHRADMGEASFGGIPIEDPAGTLALVGHKPFTVEEDDCSQPRLFTGWTTERGIGRDLDRGMFVGPNPRLHDTTIVDMQAAFGFRQITGEDGSRPEETWQARCTWILQSDYLDDAISHSEDFIVTNTVMMDAADYRSSAPSAVMDDLSDRSGNAYTYSLFWDPAATAITLFFDNDSESIGLSTLSISNVWTDVDNATCFAPDSVAKLAREPDQTYSEVVVVYNDGTQKLFRKRPATETAFIRRGTQIERPYTKSLATATSQADKWLTKHSVEVDRITCSIQVPAASAGLVQAGQSIAVRFTHLPGYETGTTMRVVSCSPKPTDDTGYWYDIALELVSATPAPVPVALVAELMYSDKACDPDQYVFPRTLQWQNTGDNPKPGWHGNPLQGALAYVDCASVPGEYSGIEVTADAIVDVVHNGQFTGVDRGVHHTVDVEIRQNGTPIASYQWVGEWDSGLHGFVRNCSLTATDIAATAGDIFTVYVSKTQPLPFGYRPNPAADQTRSQLIVSGFSSSDVTLPLPPTSGTEVTGETPFPSPDGTAVDYVTAEPYRAGSLQVTIDGIVIPASEVTETDPGQGQFALSWAPDADELITVRYLTGP